jgi:tripartite ATP-independent transporter DctP family solute receptor
LPTHCERRIIHRERPIDKVAPGGLMRRFNSLIIAGAALFAASCATPTQAQNLRFGMNTPPTDAPDYQGALAFKSYAEFNSGGKLQIKIFPSGQLGSEREMTEQVRDGALDIAWVADGNMTGFYPKIQVMAIPYLFPPSPVAWNVLRGPWAAALKEDIHKTAGFRVLEFAENGFRDFTNSKHPILTPADLKGLKMRTMESPVYITLMQSLGAAATPIGTDQLIMSLQQNVVDGEENAPSSVYTLGIADVQKFMSTDDHTFSTVMIVCSNAAYDALSPDFRHILVDAAIVMGDINNAGKAQHKALDIEGIRKKGVDVHITTGAEKAQYKQLAQGPVTDYIVKQVGHDTVDALLADEKRAEAVVYGN